MLSSSLPLRSVAQSHRHLEPKAVSKQFGHAEKRVEKNRQYGHLRSSLNRQTFTNTNRRQGGYTLRCSSDESSPSSMTYPIPQSPDETVAQAIQATRAAWREGIQYQKVELLLPLIGATDLDDWPGGIRQQFKAAAPMVESLLRNLKITEGLEGKLDAQIIEDADAVASWSNSKLTAVLFPTAESLREIKALCEGRSLSVLVNPQWMGGQVISDFGFGARRQESEEFLAPFEWTYYGKQYRIQGYDVRVLRCFPGKWQVHVVSDSGETECVAKDDDQPSYKRLEQLVLEKEGDGGGWLGRLQKELNFTVDSLKSPE